MNKIFFIYSCLALFVSISSFAGEWVVQQVIQDGEIHLSENTPMDVTKNTALDKVRRYWHAMSYADSTCWSLGYEYAADYSRFWIGMGWHMNQVPIRLSEVSQVFLGGKKIFTANEVQLLEIGLRSTPSCRESYLCDTDPAFKGAWMKYMGSRLNHQFTELWCEGDSEKVENEAILRSLIELRNQDLDELTENLRRIVMEKGVYAGETPSDLDWNLGKEITPSPSEQQGSDLNL